MSVDSQPTVSITDRVQPIAPGAPVVAVHFVGATAAFVLVEETVLLVAADGSEQRVAAHEGGILSSAVSATRLVTGGDDGAIVSIDASGARETVATDAKRRWIDRVAAGPNGAVVWGAGKAAFAQTPDGKQRSLDLPSAAGGFAFAPKGFRVAVAHYNGVSLWFPNASAPPEKLEWKGSHLGATFSPDGRFLVTTMQEPMLHGWRLVDAKHMRMSGYAAKVRSVSWSADGAWLATSGADQLILWPFQGKDGPMGKAPKMLAPHAQRVVAVACHSKQGVAAIGYADGMVMLVRIDDGAEILARRPGGGAVSGLAWSERGDRFAFGTEEGEAGIVAL